MKLEVQDPFKGKTYSQIMEGLSSDDRKKYTETPHPMISLPGTGEAIWAATIGRWVV